MKKLLFLLLLPILLIPVYAQEYSDNTPTNEDEIEIKIIPDSSISECEEYIQMNIQNTEEITQLKEQIKDLKLENRQLKLKITDLQNQVSQLEQDLENLMKQFIHDIAQITGWIIKLN